MKQRRVTAFILLLLIVNVSPDISPNSISRLYEDLFNGTYNMHVPPQIPTDISFSVQLQEIRDINDVSETLAVKVRILSWWNDDRLLWKKDEYDWLTAIQVPPHLVWKPDLALINSASDMTIAAKETSPVIAILKNTSDTVQMQWSPDGIFEIKCDFDLTFYPYDNQTCELKIGTLGSSKSFITFKYASCVKSDDLQTSTWSLEAVSRNVSDYQFHNLVARTQHVITCAYTIRRKSTFYFMNLILPLLFLGLLTPFAFFIPNEGGEKVSFIITLFLAFAVHETILMANMPVSSDRITYLQGYIVVQLALTVFVLIVTIMQSCMFHLNKLPEADESQRETKYKTYGEHLYRRWRAVSRVGKLNSILFVLTICAQVICNAVFFRSVTEGKYILDIFEFDQYRNVSLY